MIHNLASVIGGEAVVRIANYAIVLFIARNYGASTLGAYAVALSVVTILVMFLDSGLQTAAITQLSANTANRNRIYGQLTLCKVALLAVTALLLALYFAFAQRPFLFVTIGWWLTLRSILQSFSQLQMSALKSIAKATSIGTIQFIHGIALFAGLSVSYRLAWSIGALLAWVTAAQFLELFLATSGVWIGGVRPVWGRPYQLLSLLKIAAPFGLAYGIGNLIIRSDTIVLSKFIPLSELGVFSAANSILLLVYVASWLMGSVLLPEMVRLAHNADDLKHYTKNWARRFALLTIPGAILLSLAAPKLMVVFFGPVFFTSGNLAAVMLLAGPLIVLNSVFTACAIAVNSRAILLGIYGATAFVTLVLDFFLARSFGSIGVAFAILIRETFMLLAFRLFATRLVWPAAKLEFRPSSGGD
jgi:O-antigen/teichoic acid export membrane protein